MAAMQSKPARLLPALLLCLALAAALVVFGVRLIPIAEGDRAIYEAIGDGLRSGQRLYAEVYDNKDPLFLYAVALQRGLGWLGGWLFEAGGLLLAGCSLATLQRGLAGTPKPRQQWLVGVLGALLLSGGFWGAGQPQLPASAFTLLSLALLCRGQLFGAGLAAGVVAGFKLICLPLPLAFALCWLAPPGKPGRLGRFAGGVAAALLAGALVLGLRGELAAYGQTLAHNALYSQGLLVQAGTPLEVLASHGRTLFLSGKNNFLMLLALISATVICVQAAQADQPQQRLAQASLALVITGASITVATGLWAGHLQLLYPGQCLALLLVVHQWQPQFGWRRALRLPSLLLLAAFLSGTLDLSPTYWLKPQQIQHKMERIRQPSSEELALQNAFPDHSVVFARLGSNDGRIPVGWKGSTLACPDFHQYGFYTHDRLNRILTCVRSAPVVLTGPSFHLWGEIPPGLPREAQGRRITAQWNSFVSKGEATLAAHFQCQRPTGHIRICVQRQH
jgi:hypothetical protein